MIPQKGQYERYRKIFRDCRMPLAFVDLDHFDRNVRYVAFTQKNGGKTVRIHTKSLRAVSLTRRIFDLGGDAYRGLMTFTMEETAHLSGQGFDDFIVAYPTVQKSDVSLFVELVKKGARISLMADSDDHLKVLSDAAEKAKVILNVCMEVDLSFRPIGKSLHLGPRRSPIRSVRDAIDFARKASRLQGVRLNAVMGYEAHIAGPNDAVPGQSLKNAAVTALKGLSVREFFPRRAGVASILRQAGIDLEIVNGGGSGSLKVTGGDPSVTEVTAGSAFYAPALFWHYRDVDFIPSAFFAIQIVRRPADDIVTCLGGGYTASGAAGADKLPAPVYPEGLKLLPLEGAGEVQTPLLLPKNAPELQLGDPIFFQHAKAGEIAERFNELYLISGDAIVEKVPTYRGEGKAFL